MVIAKMIKGVSLDALVSQKWVKDESNNASAQSKALFSTGLVQRPQMQQWSFRFGNLNKPTLEERCKATADHANWAPRDPRSAQPKTMKSITMNFSDTVQAVVKTEIVLFRGLQSWKRLIYG